MKRLAAIILTSILVFASYVIAANQREPQKTTVTKNNNQNKQTGTKNQQVLINMNHPSSGGHNQNFPSQQKQNPAGQGIKQPPVYGKLQFQPDNKPVPQDQIRNNNQPKPLPQGQFRNNNQPKPVPRSIQSDNRPGVNTANVVHHHPYEPNYIRKKLQKLGVASEPGYIVNREEVIHTDREHSFIAYPKDGFDNHPLNATAFSPRNFNDNMVRSQMTLVGSIEWQDRINNFNQTENRVNNYYWHKDKNFNYCHYIDNSGYHWYGWYLGNKFFWTRNFNNRWWWYDADYDRWCFWNNGFWWWQDPYHIGDLYCYNNSSYIPCNSAEDNVAVVVPDNGNIRNFTSPDNTRIVKVVADTQDAFLYDTSNPPAFNPVYLASGVQDVMFSNPNNGRPLEIILKLNDQSFDMFDGSGNPYNPGTSQDSQLNQSEQ